MRVIKFRAWDAHNKKMWYPTVLGLGEDGILPEGYCQYTGLKDKNGKEIYYDDIYMDHFMKWRRIVGEMTVAHWLIDEDKMNRPMQTIEVIGNIYENPELMGVK